MRKLLIFTATVASVMAAYILFKNCACSVDDDSEMSEKKRHRHLTTAFSKAKNYTTE